MFCYEPEINSRGISSEQVSDAQVASEQKHNRGDTLSG